MFSTCSSNVLGDRPLSVASCAVLQNKLASNSKTKRSPSSPVTKDSVAKMIRRYHTKKGDKIFVVLT